MTLVSIGITHWPGGGQFWLMNDQGLGKQDAPGQIYQNITTWYCNGWNDTELAGSDESQPKARRKLSHANEVRLGGLGGSGLRVTRK